jgi:hypothetical protein
MKRNTFILIAAIIAGLFGLGFLLIPDAVMDLYGTPLDTIARFLCRYFGSALLGVAVIFWTTRNAKSLDDFIQGGLLGGLILTVTGLIVAVWDGIVGVANNFIWINTVIYGLLAIGFGYYYFKKTK